MGWHGPVLTDSGGYQVFSLAENRSIDDEGVRFKSHIDGADLLLTPESAVEIQRALGSDIMMALDDCAPADASREAVVAAMERTHRWAERCREAWLCPPEEEEEPLTPEAMAELEREMEAGLDPYGPFLKDDPEAPLQALFGIVQGGMFEDLRTESAQRIAELDLPGVAIGGVSVGEGPEEMERIVKHTAPLLPERKPRYLMGVGRPQDLLRFIGMGIDMFDCVLPTRNGRNAQAFTSDGPLHLRNARFRLDEAPIETGCDCAACRTVSRGYLRHLFQAGEMLGPIYVSIHNIRFYLRLMEEAREAIGQDRYGRWAVERLKRLEAGG
jgi:queuine tRNA-ribosyltransferase